MNLLPKAPESPLASLIEHVEVNTFGHFVDVIRQYPAEDGWVFRGQRRVQWPLKTSLERMVEQVLLERSEHPEVERFTSIQTELRAAETFLLHEFRRRCSVYAPQARFDTDFEWFAFMQHHGVPTRLLDWTESPYIALYFAVSKKQAADQATVWGFRSGVSRDPPTDRELSIDRQPRYFWDLLHLTSELTLSRSELFAPSHFAVFKADLEKHSSRNRAAPWIAAVRPLSMSARLIAQRGLFLGGTDIGANLETNFLAVLNSALPSRALIKIKLPSMSRLSTLGELDRMGITYGSLFPDLNGLAGEVQERFELDRHRERKPNPHQTSAALGG